MSLKLCIQEDKLQHWFSKTLSKHLIYILLRSMCIRNSSVVFKWSLYQIMYLYNNLHIWNAGWLYMHWFVSRENKGHTFIIYLESAEPVTDIRFRHPCILSVYQKPHAANTCTCHLYHDLKQVKYVSILFINYIVLSTSYF